MFNTKKVVVVVPILEQLEVRSEAAISIFKNTLDSLSDINSEIGEEISAKEAAIKAIKDDINILSSRDVKNRNFISKLNEFFE